MSLFYRLWVSLAVSFGLLIFALGLGEYQTLNRALASEVDRNLESRAHWVEGQLRSGQVPDGLMVPDNHPLEEIGKLFIEIYDRRGKLLRRSSNLEGGTLPARRAPGTNFQTVVTPGQRPFRIFQLETDTFTILVGESLELAHRSLDNSLLKLVLLGFSGLTAAALISHRLLWQICAPLSQLAGKAADIAKRGNVSERLPVNSRTVPEVKVVSETINQLLVRVEGLLSAQRQLLQDTSHELRNPLSVLQLDLDLLVRDDLDPAARAEVGAEFSGELKRLIRLVGDLLDLSWAETQPKIELEPVDVFVLIKRLLAAYEGRREGRSLSLVGQPTTVLADPERLEQILRNLLDNSFRYAGQSAVIHLTISTPSVDQCLVLVGDDGPGIAAEHRERVFERFYRLESDRNRLKGGTGLGLPVARALARAMGGDLWIHPDSSDGLTFCLRLPRNQLT